MAHPLAINTQCVVFKVTKLSSVSHKHVLILDRVELVLIKHNYI